MTMTSIVRHPAANQLHFIQHRGNTNDTIRIYQPTTSTTRMITHPMTNHPPTSGNPGTNGRTLHNPNLVPMHRGGLTIPRLPPNINATMTPLQVVQQTSHCIFLRPSTPKPTQIQLSPIACIHQCCPSWTYPYQSPRWFQRRMEIGRAHV